MRYGRSSKGREDKGIHRERDRERMYMREMKTDRYRRHRRIGDVRGAFHILPEESTRVTTVLVR